MGKQHQCAQVKWTLMSWFVMMVLGCSLTPCVAQSLPPVIVMGHTGCVNAPECNVAGGGTIVDVTTMTASANTAGNATATFKTQGTQFSGKLVVDCLTTNPWTNGVSLTVEIRDGARVVGTVIPTVLEFKGVLRIGSSIVIINGTSWAYCLSQASR